MRAGLTGMLMAGGRSVLLAGLCVFACLRPGVAAEGLAATTVRADAVAAAFESTVAKVSAKPGESEITVAWSFTNRWDIPLLVERFEESCGCLRGVAEKTEVAPGATGTIRASFATGGYRGTVRKSLHVRFVGFERPVELVAEVTVPSSVEVSRRELVWEKGAEPSAKTIDVKAGTDADFTITGLAGVPERNFTVAMEPVAPGRHYRITITPKGKDVPAVDCLQIRTDSADLRDRVLAVFLRTEAVPTPTAPSP